MPHKKNPDPLELIRGHCNRLRALPRQIALLCANLPTGCDRDFQLLKDALFPPLQSLKSCFRMAILLVPASGKGICEDKRELDHSHPGGIGNLGLDRVQLKFDAAFSCIA